VRTEPEHFRAKLEDAKNERSLGAEGLEARLAKLQDFVKLHIVVPCLRQDDASSEAKVNACVMLRSLFDGIFGLLNKTWYLAQARAQRVLYFTGGLNTGADVGQLPTFARMGIDRGEKADLRKIKRELKEKNWELVRAQKKVEQLERSLNMEHVLLNMERARQRDTWSRCEIERSLQEAAFIGCQQQLNELRQQQGKTSQRDRGDQSSLGRKCQSALGVLREEEPAGSEAQARKVGTVRPHRATEEDECSVRSSDQGLSLAAHARSPHTPRDRSADLPQSGVSPRGKVQTPPVGSQPAPKRRTQPPTLLGSHSVPVPRGKGQPPRSQRPKTPPSASQSPSSARGMPRKQAKTPAAVSPKLLENNLLRRCCKEPSKLSRSSQLPCKQV